MVDSSPEPPPPPPDLIGPLLAAIEALDLSPVEGGAVPLRRDAWDKASAGVTTVSEILRSVYIL